MVSFILRCFIFFMLGMHCAWANVWVRGSATVVEAEGDVRLVVPALGRSYESFDRPIYIPGLFSIHATSGGSIFMHASNRMNFAFEGEGSFAVERLEGLLRNTTGEARPLAETQSRVIMSLRRGGLFVDSRSLAEGSRLIVETPFGRLSCINAILHIRIEHDYRSGIYDFTISCAEGVVRLRDLSREVYPIYAGQRISGAGSYFAPTIEVARQTDEDRESLDGFLTKLDSLDLTKVDMAQLREHTHRISKDSEPSASNLTSRMANSAENRSRPRVIEFAPQAEAITPFRGEVKPPTEYQADLF